MSISSMRICVIGGLGFIGVNLAERLLADGAVVTILTPSRQRHADAATGLEQHGARIIEGDIRDQALMATLVDGQQLVFNLSGQSGAVRSMEDPWSDLDLNLRGNLVLLESIRAASSRPKLIFAGSRLQYGKPETIPVREDELGEPLCIHAIHKRTVEEYLKLYAHLFGVRYSIARITNPYGPGQPAGRTAYGVINRLIHLALADQAMTIYGDGTQQRDYVHVADVVDALLVIGLSDRADGRAYNVASGSGARMIDVANDIIRIAGGGRIDHVEWPLLAKQIETGDFVADVSRAAQELGWTPKWTLRAGLEDTIAHYRPAVS
jgi:UDP-glucose 4-epimerase